MFWRISDKLVPFRNWCPVSVRDSITGGGTIGSTTVRLMTVEWVREPAVPVTVMLYVPSVVLRLVVMLRVLTAVPLEDSVKEFWLPITVM